VGVWWLGYSGESWFLDVGVAVILIVCCKWWFLWCLEAWTRHGRGREGTSWAYGGGYLRDM
jgi:hypothetical protein